MVRLKPGAASSKRFDLYQHVTDQIVAALDRVCSPGSNPGAPITWPAVLADPCAPAAKAIGGSMWSFCGSLPRRRAKTRRSG